MKITRIEIGHILGLKEIDVTLVTPVALFAGRNGAGKSSISEAVNMAITQANVRDVTKKKDFSVLVHEGVKAGGATITIDNDPEQTFAFNMPKGEFTGPEITESMRVALDGQRFAQMTTDEKRTFLFGLTKLKPSAANVKERMLSKKWLCEESKVDAVLPLLRTGFPSVCDHAKSKATEAKGAWRQLTGETYGSAKAPAWEAPVPDLPAGDAAALAEKVEGYDRHLATLTESLGAIKNAAREAKDQAANRAALEGAPARVVDLTKQLEHAKGELAAYEPTVAALRQRASGKARVGLVHDMASYLFDITDMQEVSEAQRLIKRYEAEHGALVGAAAVDVEAQASLPEHEKGLGVMKNRVTNLQRDLDAAILAKAKYDALAPAEDAPDATAEIAEVESMIAAAREDRKTTENTRLDIVAALKGQEAAKGKTAKALEHHADVEAWTMVANALAPDGIPMEMLTDALAPVNAALAQAAVDAEWMTAKVAADMSITANGRPYNLLSESEQWRVDAMFAQVVAEISGLKILMLDRVDVLDLPARTQLLAWMDVLAFDGVLDSVLLFATLKALPADLPDTIASYWIEGGTITTTEGVAA